MNRAPHMTFIVRIWWVEAPEASAPLGGPRHWYGRVEHIESGQSAAFRDLSALMTFIEEQGGLQLGCEEKER
ncbi:MAG: hypothetical protein D6770_10285 [Anaerolineae bacterium]|nr:MAG: hypothetical protein D6770_10285 [Anaerolineae bacterium]